MPSCKLGGCSHRLLQQLYVFTDRRRCCPDRSVARRGSEGRRGLRRSKWLRGLALAICTVASGTLGVCNGCRLRGAPVRPSRGRTFGPMWWWRNPTSRAPWRRRTRPRRTLKMGWSRNWSVGVTAWRISSASNVLLAWLRWRSRRSGGRSNDKIAEPDKHRTIYPLRFGKRPCPFQRRAGRERKKARPTPKLGE